MPGARTPTMGHHKVAVDLVEVQGKYIMSVLDPFTRYVTLVDERQLLGTHFFQKYSLSWEYHRR